MGVAFMATDNVPCDAVLLFPVIRVFPVDTSCVRFVQDALPGPPPPLVAAPIVQPKRGTEIFFETEVPLFPELLDVLYGALLF